MKNLFLAIILAVIGFTFTVKAQQISTSETVRKAGARMAQGDRAGALEILDKAIEKKKDLFEAYRMRSSLQMMSGNIQGAIDDLSRALEIKPDVAELYDQRANFRMFLRQNDLALKDYDQAISHGLKTEKVFAGRGMVKRDAGDYDSAALDFQTALTFRPLYALAHLGLARTYELQGKADASLAQLENFVKQYEEYKNGKLPAVKGENFGEAVTIKREGTEKDGSQVFMSGIQSRVEIQSYSPEKAQFQGEQMEQRMNVAAAYLNLALKYEQRGEYERALTTIEKAFEINKSHGAVFGARGKIRLSMGDAAGALADLNQAILQMPPQVAPFADRGIALLMLGRDAAAQQDFDRFLQMFPNGKDNLNKRIEAAKTKRATQPQ